MQGNLELSVVIPLYNEEEVLDSLYARLNPVLKSLGVSYEVILVDDGSRDGTYTWISETVRKDRAFAGIRLSRNFGHQTALLAGLTEARGHFVLMMDGDLQHPPEMIPELLKQARSGFDIVYTIRMDDCSNPFKRLTRKIFYKLFHLLSDTDLEENTADFRIVSRRVCDEIIHLDERDLFLRGIVAWIGFPRKKIPYHVDKREKGTSKYTFKKMMSLFISGMTSFSVAPIRLSIILCWLSFFISFVAVLYALASYLFFGTVGGWTSLLILMSFFFACVFLILAIMGEYIGKIHIEAKKRPRYFIQDRTSERKA